MGPRFDKHGMLEWACIHVRELFYEVARGKCQWGRQQLGIQKHNNARVFSVGKDFTIVLGSPSSVTIQTFNLLC